MPDPIPAAAPPAAAPPAAAAGTTPPPGPGTPPPAAPAAPAAAPVTAPAPPALTAPGAPNSKIALEKANLLREKAVLEQERAALKGDKEQVAAWKQVAESKDPAKILAAAGLGEADIAAWLVSGGKTAPDEKQVKLDQRLSAAEQRVKDIEEQAKREKDAASERAINEWKRETAANIEGNAEAYPHIAALGQGHLIYGEIERHFNETGGEILDEEQAAANVEKRIAETFPAQLERVLKVPKLREMIEKALKPADAPPPAGTPPAPAATEASPVATSVNQALRDRLLAGAPKAKTPPKTLTSTLHGTADGGAPPPSTMTWQAARDKIASLSRK